MALTAEAQTIKLKISKLDYIKFKTSVCQKTVNSEKATPPNGKKYLKIVYLVRGYIKNFYNSKTKI